MFLRVGKWGSSISMWTYVRIALYVIRIIVNETFVIFWYQISSKTISKTCQYYSNLKKLILISFRRRLCYISHTCLTLDQFPTPLSLCWILEWLFHRNQMAARELDSTLPFRCEILLLDVRGLGYGHWVRSSSSSAEHDLNVRPRLPCNNWILHMQLRINGQIWARHHYFRYQF